MILRFLSNFFGELRMTFGMRAFLVLALPIFSLAACENLPTDSTLSANRGQAQTSPAGGYRTVGGLEVGAAQFSALSAGGTLPSDPAKECQKDGWASLVRTDGSGFRNTGDCVSYRVRGGEFGSGDNNCRTGSSGSFDFLITGSANSPGSGSVFASTNGSCTGNSSIGTYIVADSYGDAVDLCFDATSALDQTGFWSPGVVILDEIGTNEWACADARFLP